MAPVVEAFHCGTCRGFRKGSGSAALLSINLAWRLVVRSGARLGARVLGTPLVVCILVVAFSVRQR